VPGGSACCQVTGRLAAIFGCAGEVLTESEIKFFKNVRPVGLILFARNCQAPAQVRHLIHDFRNAVATEDVLILIDQEGGRVCRLGPPHWRLPPAAAVFGHLFASNRAFGIEATRLNGQVIAAELHDLGINVDCVPVLDVRVQGAHEIIGDRAFSSDPNMVAALGSALIDGLLAGGVLPVMKHIPGHGRAMVDSHLDLPVVTATREVLNQLDFAPFKSLTAAPLAMTAHVKYTAFDEHQPATTSSDMISLIRNDIGFDGLLMTDDLSMKALPGTIADRAVASRGAGCDVLLHCNGNLHEMQIVGDHAGPLDNSGLRRLSMALGQLGEPEPIDVSAAMARIDSLLVQGGEKIGP
jgi:beta-N-acetylhexosaminidase